MSKKTEDFKPSDRIRRAKHQSNYTLILNATIRDEGLSWKARGLHHYILSLPDTWEINIAHLSKQSDRDGADVVKSALKELESRGYISKKQVRDEGGKFNRTEWTVYEEPQVDLPQVGNPHVDKPSTVKPHAGEPSMVKPSTVDPSLRITNKELSISGITNLESNYSETPLTPQGELCDLEIPFSDLDIWEPDQENPDRTSSPLAKSEVFKEPAQLAKIFGVETFSAAEKKSAKPTKSEIAQCFEAFRLNYNELMGDIWAKCEKASDDRLKLFIKVWGVHKETLFEDLYYASICLHKEKWSTEKGWTIDTVMRAGSLTRYAELGRSGKLTKTANEIAEERMARTYATLLKMEQDEIAKGAIAS